MILSDFKFRARLELPLSLRSSLMFTMVGSWSPPDKSLRSFLCFLLHNFNLSAESRILRSVGE